MVTKLDITRIKQFLSRPEQKNFDLKDIVRLAELMTDSMLILLEGNDEQTYDGLSKISQQISDTRRDLAEFRGGEMHGEHIPEAGRELDEVVEATENATNTIMEAAETIMGGDPSDPDAYAEMVNDEVMKIFEACSFQDITGQRIAKVVKTLDLIESQIGKMIDYLDDQQKAKAETREKLSNELPPADDLLPEGVTPEDLLNGPAFTGEGVQQDDVDKLFD